MESVFWGTFSFFEASLASATRYGTFERKSQHLMQSICKKVKLAQAGLEPTTFWSEDQCSTTELLRILRKETKFLLRNIDKNWLWSCSAILSIELTSKGKMAAILKLFWGYFEAILRPEKYFLKIFIIFWPFWGLNIRKVAWISAIKLQEFSQAESFSTVFLYLSLSWKIHTLFPATKAENIGHVFRVFSHRVVQKINFNLNFTYLSDFKI